MGRDVSALRAIWGTERHGTDGFLGAFGSGQVWIVGKAGPGERVVKRRALRVAVTGNPVMIRRWQSC